MGKIFVGGDVHGDMNQVYQLAQLNNMKSDDYYIICGDFGFIWNGEWHKNITKLQRACKATILFIDGNHENFNILESLPIEERFGSPVHICGDRVFHLMRGNVYTIEGHTFFTFGGARSTDKMYRTVNKSWWFREEPTVEEITDGQKILEENLQNIEYVLTHDCPDFLRKKIDKYYLYGPPITDYLLPAYFDKWYEKLLFDGLSFKYWFFGHHHVDMPLEEYQACALYKEIVVIN